VVDLALDLVRTTPGFSPPVASRAFGYAGVALYQAVVPGISGCRSFAGQLNGLTEAPRPASLACHWPTVASSALASILRALFPTPTVNRVAIEELERRVSTRLQCGKEAGRGWLPQAGGRWAAGRAGSSAGTPRDRHLASTTRRRAWPRRLQA
jgi:hypothetical protein